ncbi:CCA tRNA nucleotidyltransferase 1, mitochondrial [Trichinella pseudospiralis]|uniref:CCA tRNA nucleotidyltransferase 1, mitochondrial n=1 Tax=Trichinella pseudospiralis TaxID=6337 RepID=A0A0V0Y759_TRIPS|nr:CCA tRNA nucleotidyltransferase 1, mitochondrial [Trichinella pseudospiralis]
MVVEKLIVNLSIFDFLKYNIGCTRHFFFTMKIEGDMLKCVLTPPLMEIKQLFEKKGYEIRIAGGAVRDLLLNIVPVDIDLATTARPEEMNQLFLENSIRMLNKGGEKHGTVTCRIQEQNFEITTLRVDKSCHGRHAEVEFTTDWFLDANRRDLTISTARFYGRLSDKSDEHDLNTLSAIKHNAEGLSGLPKNPTIENFAEVFIIAEPFKPLSITMISALLENEQQICDLNSRLKLSTEDRVICEFIVGKRDEAKKIRDLQHQAKYFKNACFNTYSRSCTPDSYKRSCELMKYHGFGDALKIIESWKAPKFPVTGHMLANLNIKPGPVMSIVLTRLFQKWMNSEFQMTAGELIDAVKELPPLDVLEKEYKKKKNSLLTETAVSIIPDGKLKIFIAPARPLTISRILSSSSIWKSSRINPFSNIYVGISCSKPYLLSILVCLHHYLWVFCYFPSPLPSAKTATAAFYVGGTGTFLYFLHSWGLPTLKLLLNYSNFIIAYLIVMSALSCAVVYRYFIPVHPKSVQLVGHFFSIVGIFVILWNQPAPIPLLSESEYINQGRIETARNLENLRAFAKSPDFDTWHILGLL